MTNLLKYGLLAGLSGLAIAAFAGTNISLFGGNNYAEGNDHAATLQFEHASEWAYGDNYFFFDVTDPHRDETSIYGEWHPRLSFSKITGHKVGIGAMSDVLLAGQLNVGSNNKRIYMLGLGSNWDVPGFKFIKLNAYWRRNIRYPGSTFQITTGWGLPFQVSDKWAFLFAGFVDYAGRQSIFAQNLLAKPRLMLDLGNLLGVGAGQLYTGIQYVYWHNRSGVKGREESVPEWMITWSID